MGEHKLGEVYWKAVDEIKHFPSCDDGDVSIKLKEYNQILIKNERLARQVHELQTTIQELAAHNDSRVIVIVKDEDDEIKGIDLCKFDDVKKEVEERIEENIEEMDERLDELSKEVVKLMEENAVLKYDIAQLRERGLWKRIFNK